MKRTMSIVFGIFVLNSAIALADSAVPVDVSFENWNITGNFDYILHYQNSSQVLSKVSMPQSQSMRILTANVKTNDASYIKIRYGSTAFENKGMGSDSDWQNSGSSTITDYGTMNFNGKQKMYSVDFGTKVLEDERNNTSIFIGWGENTTNNALTNVIYHLESGVNVGNVPQSDNGSYLNGTFSGLRLGAETRYKINEKLTLDSGLTTSFFKATANGHWMNHSPAWDWTDSGDTFGYNMNIGLKYAFTRNTLAEIGYYYSYAKLTNGSETLNYNNGISDKFSGIGLEYKQRGYYFGLNAKL